MGAIKTEDSVVLLTSLTDLVPFLSSVKSIILLIAQAVEEVNDNNNQCLYLLRRCTHMCVHVNELCLEKGITDSFGALEEFKQCVIILFVVCDGRQMPEKCVGQDSNMCGAPVEKNSAAAVPTTPGNF